MFDTSRALADMANQIRTCRSADGLTLQQLATRSGVAASTIHKVEARQMVPTVSVLLKIAKGLGCRPEELIRDRFEDETAENVQETLPNGRSENGAMAGGPPTLPPQDVRPTSPEARPAFGVWKLDLSRERALPTLDLAPQQRAIVLVEDGAVDLRTGDRSVRMDAGDCIEVEGGRIEPGAELVSTARVTLIVSPPGDLAARLGRGLS
ncbi:MAG: helix-turn-helix domain-containing protein [bacterium]|nr:helix-turn-helix domain-containing protein [bacterium]